MFIQIWDLSKFKQCDYASVWQMCDLDGLWISFQFFNSLVGMKAVGVRENKLYHVRIIALYFTSFQETVCV